VNKLCARLQKSISNFVLQKIKKHFGKDYNIVFWCFFGPGMFMTLMGVYELYTKYFDQLTSQDHMQFFLRFFFPIALATFVTALERRQRKQKADLIERGEDYLRRNRSIK
jgi:hypothetical protein